MGDTIIRTTTHFYPKRELDVMNAFYGDRVQSKCCITHESSTQWAHILPTSIVAATDRLKDMLDRGLRQERVAAHSAELRENLIPLDPSRHAWFDAAIPTLTVFLHEDTLARMLAFELDLAKLRLDSMAAGFGDPGRPSYEHVFETIDDAVHPSPVSRHRVHSLRNFVRWADEPHDPPHIYHPSQCPGIPSQNPFPVLDTLLSLPFSLIHTLPRLAAMLPKTNYQNDVLRMGLNILDLWFWDPPANLVIGIAVPDNVTWPPPVMDKSRDVDTFERWKDIQIPDSAAADFLRNGEVTRNVKDSLAVPVENDIAPRKPLVLCHLSDTSSLDYYVNSQASSSASEDPGDGASMTDPVAERNRMVDVAQWRDAVNSCMQEDVAEELIPSPYEQSGIGGMSMNDYLMVHGAIHPKVWLAFLDLSLSVYST